MANQFIFSDPDLDFVLRDGGLNQDFDGIADVISPEFGTVILGIDRDIRFQNLGEKRSIAEFDISSLPSRLDGSITQATFEVRVSSTQSTGLGQGFDDVATSISVYGYEGNGVAEASDFQAGNLLDTLDITGVARDDILAFDVTEFINTTIANNESFAGLAIRTDDFGSISTSEFNEFPQLQIQTDGASAPILLSNPEVDFQVLDRGRDFDGLGDSDGVFSTFSGAILGADRALIAVLPEVGEERSILEFDISGFAIPDGEEITEARLEVQISDTQVAGLGQDGSASPSQLSLYGYVGNGIAELSDFNAGTLIDIVDSSSATVGERLSLDLTGLARAIVDNGETTIGLGIRTDAVGGIGLGASSTLEVPRLVIETSESINSGGDVVTVNLLLDEEDGNVNPGDISLREALQIVTPGGTINFAPGLTQTDAGFGQGVLGLTLGELVIDRSVTINGLGSDQLILEQATLETASNDNPNPFARVLLVDDGDADTQAEVEINGLVITGGSLLAGDGSGVFNRESLILKDSNVTGNGYVFGNSARGAGIFNTGTLQVINSLISDNRGVASYNESGGTGLGLFNEGIAEVINSEISNHSAGSGRGAGIFNTSSGTLTLRNSTLKSNGFDRSGFGGGLANRGAAVVIESTIEQNAVSTPSRFLSAGGGGIDNRGTLDLIRSTVTGNRVSSSGTEQGTGIGGGINNTGTLNVSNSTISANRTSRQGGGIRNSGLAEIENSSIVFNTRQGFAELDQGGGGLYSTDDATTTVVNSIIAGNTDDRPRRNVYAPDIFGSLDGASAFNIVGDGSGSTVQNGVNGNQVGTTANPIAPTLGPLQDNGGPTFTHALLDDSPAINAGSNALIPDRTTTDQRGEVRIVGDTVDIGAYESDVSDPGELDTVPTVENPIADQLAQVAQTFLLELPDDVFEDEDGDVLTTSANLEDGQPLPNWLSFDGDTETLTGTPQDSDVGTVAIAITATDDDDNQVTDIFDLTVEPSTPIFNEINGDDGKNRINGKAVADLIRGFGSKDLLRGLDGNDQIFGGTGNDTLGGNKGNDQLFGGVGKDRLFGGPGDDKLFGEEEGDRLLGNDGNDELSGGDGNDFLNGEAGNDLLIGGTGRNQVRGGSGNDSFVLEQGAGFSQILDFQLGEDTILLPEGLRFDDLTITQANRKSQVLVGDDLALEIFRVEANKIDASVFQSL